MERSKTSPYLKIIGKECCKMKFLSNEKLFKCVCLFIVGTQLMKIILSVALGLFVVYALLNLIISIQEKNKK